MALLIMAVAAVLALSTGPAHAAGYEPAAVGVSTTSVGEGGTFTASASGFDSGVDVTFVFNSTPVTLGVLVADATGSVSGSFNVPSGSTIGMHTITATGLRNGQVTTVATSIEVVAVGTAAAAGSPPVSTGSLPVTGSNNAVGYTIAAAFLVVLGGFVVLASRRRTAVDA